MISATFLGFKSWFSSPKDGGGVAVAIVVVFFNTFLRNDDDVLDAMDAVSDIAFLVAVDITICLERRKNV